MDLIVTERENQGAGEGMLRKPASFILPSSGLR